MCVTRSSIQSESTSFHLWKSGFDHRSIRCCDILRHTIRSEPMEMIMNFEYLFSTCAFFLFFSYDTTDRPAQSHWRYLVAGIYHCDGPLAAANCWPFLSIALTPTVVSHKRSIYPRRERMTATSSICERAIKIGTKATNTIQRDRRGPHRFGEKLRISGFVDTPGELYGNIGLAAMDQEFRACEIPKTHVIPN